MNLLHDPIFRVETEEGLKRLSLPELLAELSLDRVESFPGLQRHQEEAFYIFLCSLAGAVLARRGLEDPPQVPNEWRAGVLELAEGQEEAWGLVVEDLSKPAFMQPPLPKADHKRLKRCAVAADELDVLVTAKNHDLKRARALGAELDEWLYGLITLQTMSGYSGGGNQGISRMNSGFGSRAVVEVVHSRRWGRRFREALPRLLRHRQKILQGPREYTPKGLVLVWLREWDGKDQISLSELDPFYIEICRRVRLFKTAQGLEARSVPADQPRIAAKELRGNVGDAWLPIDKAGKKGDQALTVSSAGITADLLRRILFRDGIELTELQKPLPAREGDLWLSFSVLVRGQGRTEGFHERWLPIPKEKQSTLFGASGPPRPLAELAKTAIEFAGTMQRSVLKPAVFSLLGAPERLQLDRDAIDAWWRKLQSRFDALWSDDYFPWLWSVAEDFDRGEEERRWLERLKKHAETILKEAWFQLPLRNGRSFASRVAAERKFYQAIKKQFPQLEEVSHGA